MKLTIIGASGHGKVVADIAIKRGYDQIEFLDDNDSLEKCGQWPVVGKVADAGNVKNDIIIAIGNSATRRMIYEQLDKKYIVSLIHPDAIIADGVVIGKGTVVMAGAVINACAIIGDGCIINTCSSVDHDCVIGDFAHVSVGVHISGTVYIGEDVWLGIGTVVSNNINICNGCMIGAGTVVIHSIDQPGTYIGVPAHIVIGED